MFEHIPGGQKIKRSILKIFLGLVLIPCGLFVLFYNEVKCIQKLPLWEGWEHPSYYFWIIRAAGFIITAYGFGRILSAFARVSRRIPLTGKEVKTGVFANACMLGFVSSFSVISVCWLYHKPWISVVLLGLAIAFIFALLIRRAQKRKIEKGQMPSVKPKRSLDT